MLMDIFLTIILFFIILSYIVLYSEIVVYDIYTIRDNRTGLYENAKLINKNIFYVTLAYTNKDPQKMATIIFMLKTLLNI